MENKKHNLVAGYIFTIITLVGLTFSIMLYGAAKAALHGENVAVIFFGGIIMAVFFLLLDLLTMVFGIYPVVRSSRLLFGEKDRRVSVWILFVISVAVLLTTIILAFTVFL